LIGFTPGFLFVRAPEYDANGNLSNFA
jgi:hypothetical protein